MWNNVSTLEKKTKIRDMLTISSYRGLNNSDKRHITVQAIASQKPYTEEGGGGSAGGSNPYSDGGGTALPATPITVTQQVTGLSSFFSNAKNHLSHTTVQVNTHFHVYM